MCERNTSLLNSAYMYYETTLSTELSDPSFSEYLSLGFQVESQIDGSVERLLPDFEPVENLILSQFTFLLEQYISYSLITLEKIQSLPILFLELNDFGEVRIRDIKITCSLLQYQQGLMLFFKSLLLMINAKVDKYKKRHSKQHLCTFPRKTAGAQQLVFRSNKYHELFCLEQLAGTVTWFEELNKSLIQPLSIDIFLIEVVKSQIARTDPSAGVDPEKEINRFFEKVSEKV